MEPTHTHSNTIDGIPLAIKDPGFSVPGTVRLFENHLQHGGFQADGGGVILVPAPTTNVNDPLNWSKGEKLWVSSTLLLWTFLANACIAWCSPSWAIWVVDLKTDFTQLSYGQALLVMTCGVGVMFLQPVALKYGRRLSYLIGSLLIIAGLACGLSMTSIGLYFVYMTLGGFGSAPSYSTIVTSLLDISFLHQKGKALSIYGFVLLLGNFLPPLAAGYIVDSQGWVWVFRYLLVFFGVSTLLVLFTAEETSFARFANHVQEAVAVPSETVASNPNPKDKMRQSQVQAAAGPASPQPADVAERFTYLQKMTIYRNNHEVKAGYWRLVLSMAKVTALPAALWASFQLAISTLVVGVVMTTQASFFSIPPYNFTPAQMGLMYIPLMIGSFMGVFIGGTLADWLLVRMARKSDGIHEPENRLWVYLLVPPLAAAGCLLYGVGASIGVHWILPCIGLFLIGVYTNVCLPIALGYALDSYPEVEDEIVQLSNFVRNVGGGALTFCIQPWINASGPRNTIIYLVVIIFVVHATSIIFQFRGKALRSRSASVYYRICEQCIML
ncbi:major facilitator superfamily domain-containing protein [Fusarium sp. MPI-SDFR-AT-0072]|nr:major facilitator superfamily domain-containing protein [Fusarium sp. MPI-SDFR-AT-0072]